MSSEFKPVPIYRDCLLRSIREGGGGGEGGGCDCDMTSYLLKEDAERNYQPKGSYATLQSDGKIPYSELPDDIKDRGNCSCDMSKYLDQQHSDVRCLTREDAKTLNQPFGDYSTKEEIKRTVLKYEDVKVPYRDVYQGFQQMMLYIQNKKTGWTYDRDLDFKKNKLEELITEMFNHYQNNPIITVDEANDKSYFKFNTKKILTNSNKPLYGSLIVFDATHPSKRNVSSFAFLWDAGGGKDHFEYWKLQENYFIFGQQILENIRWDEGSNSFEIVYYYSGGYRLNLETIRTFIFSDVPDLVPIQRDEINLLENVLNKGKPNGYVPLNERSKIDTRFLPESNNNQETNPSTTTNENEINSDLMRYLNEDGIILKDEYKDLIIHAQKNYKILETSQVYQTKWEDYCFTITATHPTAPGSIFMSYYYNEANEVKRGYFLFISNTNASGLNNGDAGPLASKVHRVKNEFTYDFEVDNLCSKDRHHDDTKLASDKCFNSDVYWRYYKNYDECYPPDSIVLLEDGLDAKDVYYLTSGRWEKLCSQTIEGKIINYWYRVE